MSCYPTLGCSIKGAILLPVLALSFAFVYGRSAEGGAGSALREKRASQRMKRRLLTDKHGSAAAGALQQEGGGNETLLSAQQQELDRFGFEDCDDYFDRNSYFCNNYCLICGGNKTAYVELSRCKLTAYWTGPNTSKTDKKNVPKDIESICGRDILCEVDVYYIKGKSDCVGQ